MIIGQVDKEISQPICDVLESETVPWIYNKTTYNENFFQFTYDIIKDNGYKGPLYEVLIVKLWRFILQKHPDVFENYKDLCRVKANLLTKNGRPGFHTPHIDNNFEHLVILYYVNNSDGDTYFFNDNIVVDRVSPKQGKYIIFDGDQYHASSSPTDTDARIVINFNVLINTI